MTQNNVKKLAEIIAAFGTTVKIEGGRITILPDEQKRLAKSILEAIELDEGKIDKIIKNYFGYRDISTPVYNMTYQCELSEAIAQDKSVIKIKEGKCHKTT